MTVDDDVHRVRRERRRRSRRIRYPVGIAVLAWVVYTFATGSLFDRLVGIPFYALGVACTYGAARLGRQRIEADRRRQVHDAIVANALWAGYAAVWRTERPDTTLEDHQTLRPFDHGLVVLSNDRLVLHLRSARRGGPAPLARTWDLDTVQGAEQRVARELHLERRFLTLRGDDGSVVELAIRQESAPLPDVLARLGASATGR